MDDATELDAGRFSAWTAAMTAAISGQQDAAVPCGTCTACCTSSQFVHIGPDETDTLARIPRHLLFPAPRMAKGHVLLGYDAQGRCPMLSENGCSIYAHRPKTCRTYDCRVFPATGLAVDDGESAKTAIGRQARRWRFRFENDDDRRRHDAVRAAAASLRVAGDGRPADVPGPPVTQVAARAIEIHEEFLS